MPRKIFDSKRSCRYCKDRKEPSKFHQSSIYTCLDCLGDLDIYEFKDMLRISKNKKREVYRKKHKATLLKKLGDAKSKRGYIYLLHSASEGFYKIGVGVDPHKRCQDIKNSEYKIHDLKLLAFSVPIDDAFKTECWIHHKLRDYNVAYVKPCGGVARELFNCSFNEVSKLFIGCSQEIEWMDKDSFKSVNLSKIPKIKNFERSRMRPIESVIKKKMHRDFRNYRRSIENDWRLFNSMNLQRLKCFATGDREDHLFESVFDKKNKSISLGIFKDPEVAIKISREFGSFIKSEKKLKRKYIKKIIDGYPPWLLTPEFYGRMSGELMETL